MRGTETTHGHSQSSPSTRLLHIPHQAHLAPGVGGEQIISFLPLSPSALDVTMEWRLGATPGRKEMNHNRPHPPPNPNHYHSEGQIWVSALTHQRPLFYVARVALTTAGGGDA